MIDEKTEKVERQNSNAIQRNKGSYTDDLAPWPIRGVPMESRAKAKKAAKAKKMSLGKYIAELIDYNSAEAIKEKSLPTVHNPIDQLTEVARALQETQTQIAQFMGKLTEEKSVPEKKESRKWRLFS